MRKHLNLNIAEQYDFEYYSKRKETKCKNNNQLNQLNMSFEDFIEYKLAEPITVDISSAQYSEATDDEKMYYKNNGGFLGARLHENYETLYGNTFIKRRKVNLASRTIVAIDIDEELPEGYNLKDKIESLDVTCVAYTTFNHTPEKPRYRVLFPLATEISVDEYLHYCDYLNEKLLELPNTVKDMSGDRYAQVMFYPAVKSDRINEYEFIDNDVNNFFDPKAVSVADYVEIAKVNDVRARSYNLAPVSEEDIVTVAGREMINPAKKTGIIGIFCSKYTITGAIDAHLSDIYEYDTSTNRGQRINGTSSWGMEINEDCYAYFHNNTDSQLFGEYMINSFDLVRINKFGDTEESYKEMRRLMMQEPDLASKVRTDSIRTAPSAKYSVEDSKEALVQHCAMLKLALGTTKKIIEEQITPMVITFNAQLKEPLDITDIESIVKDTEAFSRSFMIKQTKVNYQNLAEHILRNEDLLFYNSHFFLYEAGVYKILNEYYLKRMLLDYLPYGYQETRHMMELMKMLEIKSFSEDAKLDDGYVNVKNGLLNLDTMELIPHTPEKKTINQFEVNYNPNITEEDILNSRFHKDFLMKSLGGDIETINLLRNYISIALKPQYQKKIQKGLFMHSDRASNGKSVFMTTIQKVLGSKNYCNIELSEFGKAENLHPLAGAVACMVDESETFQLQKTATLKTAISNKEIKARKLYSDAVPVSPACIFIFNCNKTIISNDKSGGMSRRSVVVEWSKSFGTEEDVASGRKDYVEDIHLEDYILENELEIVFAWLIQGLKDLESKNCVLSIPQAVKISSKKAEHQNDKALEFVETVTFRENQDADIRVPIKEFYDMFVDWCNNNEVVSLPSKTALGRALRKKYTDIDGRSKTGSKCYINIGLRKIGTDFDKTDKEMAELRATERLGFGRGSN